VSRTNSHPARFGRRADEGSTLVLLHPGETTESALAGHLVAVLFAAAVPLSNADVARVLDVPPERLEDVCDLLEREPPIGLGLQRHADHLQLTTAPGSAAIVERFLGAPPAVRLSRAALEALAVIAYKQPVTRGEIDAIRGVNSDSAVATLLTRNLVAEVGRRETVGRPALLAVTPDFLGYLGLRSLDELPALQTSDVRSQKSEVRDEPPDDAIIEVDEAIEPALAAEPAGAEPQSDF
jgi:segregation and condensation protein B